MRYTGWRFGHALLFQQTHSNYLGPFSKDPQRLHLWRLFFLTPQGGRIAWPRALEYVTPLARDASKTKALTPEGCTLMVYSRQPYNGGSKKCKNKCEIPSGLVGWLVCHPNDLPKMYKAPDTWAGRFVFEYSGPTIALGRTWIWSAAGCSSCRTSCSTKRPPSGTRSWPGAS